MDLSQPPLLDTQNAAGETAASPLAWLCTRGLAFPLVLALIGLTAFVPLIYRLGFYWDDWPTIWFLHTFGPGSFRQGFSIDRPLLAWVFMITTPLIGESPLGWQLFGVLARLLAGLAVWALLLGIWPERRRLAGAAAILFTLYPGFTQQYISVTYANAFLVFCVYLFSLAGMVWAIRLSRSGRTGKARWLLAASFIAAWFGLFTSEYFAGLELLRPVLIWLILGDEPAQAQHWQARARLTLRYWLPFLALYIVFVTDRLSDKTPRADVVLFGQLRSSPVAAITGLIATLGQDFWEANLLAWGHGLDPATLNDFDSTVLLLFAASMLASAGLALIWGRWGESSSQESAAFQEGGSAWRWLPLLLGLVAFFAAGWPVWITNLRLELFFPWDRLTLMTMLGSCLLAAGLLELVAGRRWLWAVGLAILVGLSVGAQFQYRLAYRQEWLAQQNFFWQLSWRIPALQPGTLLLTSEIPFSYYTDNSLSAPLNAIYAPQNAGQVAGSGGRAQMATLLYDIEARLGKGLRSLEAGTPVHEPYRAAVFDGSTGQAVVLFYDPPRCLKVIDPAVDRFLPVKPLYIREAAPLSRLDLILPHPAQPAVPPAAWFGPEPAPNWCTYFEKAELYNQAGEWEKAAEMADKALKTNRHYTEKNVAELNAFIEAYAHTGKWQKAVELTGEAYQTWDKMQYELCDVWKRIQQTTTDSPERQTALQNIENRISCNLP